MQTSSKKLTPRTQQETLDSFFTLIADLKNPIEVKAFIESFMSKTEVDVFSKRLAILWMLHQGKSYDEISHELKVSSATISSLSNLHRQLGIKVALRKIKLDKFLDKKLRWFW